MQWYWKGDFFTEISDRAIEEHVRYGAQRPTLLSIMHLYPIDGRVNQISPDATAFSFLEMNEGLDRVRATYRDNYPRLAAIKAQYDPNNLFRVNQNIRPQSP